MQSRPTEQIDSLNSNPTTNSNSNSNSSSNNPFEAVVDEQIPNTKVLVDEITGDLVGDVEKYPYPTVEFGFWLEHLYVDALNGHPVLPEYSELKVKYSTYRHNPNDRYPNKVDPKEFAELATSEEFKASLRDYATKVRSKKKETSNNSNKKNRHPLFKEREKPKNTILPRKKVSSDSKPMGKKNKIKTDDPVDAITGDFVTDLESYSDQTVTFRQWLDALPVNPKTGEPVIPGTMEGTVTHATYRRNSNNYYPTQIAARDFTRLATDNEFKKSLRKYAEEKRKSTTTEKPAQVFDRTIVDAITGDPVTVNADPSTTKKFQDWLDCLTVDSKTGEPIMPGSKPDAVKYGAYRKNKSNRYPNQISHKDFKKLATADEFKALLRNHAAKQKGLSYTNNSNSNGDLSINSNSNSNSNNSETMKTAQPSNKGQKRKLDSNNKAEKSNKKRYQTIQFPQLALDDIQFLIQETNKEQNLWNKNDKKNSSSEFSINKELGKKLAELNSLTKASLFIGDCTCNQSKDRYTLKINNANAFSGVIQECLNLTVPTLSTNDNELSFSWISESDSDEARTDDDNDKSVSLAESETTLAQTKTKTSTALIYHDLSLSNPNPNANQSTYQENNSSNTEQATLRQNNSRIDLNANPEEDSEKQMNTPKFDSF